MELHFESAVTHGAADLFEPFIHLAVHLKKKKEKKI